MKPLKSKRWNFLTVNWSKFEIEIFLNWSQKDSETAECPSLCPIFHVKLRVEYRRMWDIFVYPQVWKLNEILNWFLSYPSYLPAKKNKEISDFRAIFEPKSSIKIPVKSGTDSEAATKIYLDQFASIEPGSYCIIYRFIIHEQYGIWMRQYGIVHVRWNDLWWTSFLVQLGSVFSIFGF